MTPCLMCPSCATFRAIADRSARAAVDAARELGTVASEAIAAHDALDVAARELLTATLARDTAHTAHTNAGPSMRRAAMDALCDARGRYTRAVEAAARVVDGTTTRAEVPCG